MDGEETSSNQSEPQASNSDQMLASDCVDKPQSSPSEAGEESVPSITVTAGKTHMKIYPDLGGGAVKPPAKKIMRRTEIGADGKKKLFWDLLPWDDVYDPATAQWTPEDFLPKDGTTVDPMIKGLAQIASRLLWDGDIFSAQLMLHGECDSSFMQENVIRTRVSPPSTKSQIACVHQAPLDPTLPWSPFHLLLGLVVMTFSIILRVHFSTLAEVCWPGRITYEGAVRYWMKTFSVHCTICAKSTWFMTTGS